MTMGDDEGHPAWWFGSSSWLKPAQEAQRSVTPVPFRAPAHALSRLTQGILDRIL